jgi:hypothetical protein
LATAKQIAANRRNAKRSTGPKTVAGKMKSSRNAYRHGLSSPVLPDPATPAKVNLIAHELAGEHASEDRLMAAEDLIRAQETLLRIKSTHAEQFAKVAIDDIGDLNMRELKRLAALDRYERYALTERRRASQQLRSLE